MGEWTDERVEQLKKLDAEKLTFSTIARIIGGVTRHACISKAHRLGLPPREVQKRAIPRPVADKPKRHNDGVIAAPLLPRPAPKGEPVPIGPIHDFPPVGTCRFIRAEIATDSDWRCCGAPAPDYARPWCSFHRPKVYQSAATRQRDKGVSELSQIARNLRKMEAAE